MTLLAVRTVRKVHNIEHMIVAVASTHISAHVTPWSNQTECKCAVATASTGLATVGDCTDLQGNSNTWH